MRINYFSPLPPATSGIAEVAAQVIPALSQYGEVTAWTDQNTWDSALESCSTVRQYDPATIWHTAHHDLNSADLNIYHIGNNVKFHGAIWQMSQQAPGIVVLHDARLQHLFYNLISVQNCDTHHYINVMTQTYGNAAGFKARQVAEGKLPITAVEDYGMTEWAVDNAVGVLVHTQQALQDLADHNRWPIGYQPLPFHAPPRLTSHPAAAPPYRLIIFGYIAHNRRIETVLEAIGRLDQRNLFRLDIYGELLADQSKIQQQIERFNLQHQVTIHGFVDDEVLDAALSQAHLAINLRNPTMGEASISQLRIWRHALPTLVTQIGWYAEQPDNTVCFVDPNHEVRDIQRHLQQLIDQPEQFHSIGENGRQLLEELHAPDAYARAIIEFGQQHSALGRQSLSIEYWMQRSAAIVIPWGGYDFPPQSFKRLTTAIHDMSQT